MYYVTIENTFENTYLRYTYNVYFDCKESKDRYVKFFKEHYQTNLFKIVKSGKAKFNDKGILTP